MSQPVLTDLPAPPLGKTGWPWTEQSDPLPDTQPDGTPWPKISIVTPSYNQGEFIEETIRSVLLQGYPNLEYIVMDGGSDDETVSILEKYNPWIDYWVSEDDNGQAHAINKGLSQATGQIAAWINSDDMYLPLALEHVGDLYKQTQFDVFVGRRYAEKPEFQLQHPRSSLILLYRYIRPFVNPFWFPGTRYDIPQECVFWDHGVYNNKKIDESFNFTMDVEWFKNIFSGAKVVYSSREVGYYREHARSKSSTLKKLWRKESKMHYKKYKKYEKNISPVDRYRVFCKYVYSTLLGVLKSIMSPKSKEDYIFIYNNPNYIRE